MSATSNLNDNNFSGKQQWSGPFPQKSKQIDQGDVRGLFSVVYLVTGKMQILN